MNIMICYIWPNKMSVKQITTNRESIKNIKAIYQIVLNVIIKINVQKSNQRCREKIYKSRRLV